MFTNMLFCDHFILTYCYVHKYAPIIMYGLGLFIQELQRLQHFQYDVARRVSELHKSAKFHGLVLFIL